MKPVSKPIHDWEWSALFIIVLVAALLRLGAPGITEFKRDEANLSQLALDMAHGRDLPLLGISSSVGVPNPPLNIYLFALPYTVDSTPITATLFVGALNVLAVMLASGFARRYYGPVAGIITGILYATSPWAVIYSRKIWAQDLLPPFVVLTVFTGLLGYGENKRWAQLAHWPLLLITVQLHYGAFTLIPLSGLMLLLRRKSIKWRKLGVGFLLAALTLIPVLIGAIQDDMLTVDTLNDGLDQTEHQRTISTTSLDYARLTIAGTNIHSLAGPEQFEIYLDSVPDVYWLFDLLPLGVLIAAGWILWRLLRMKTAQSTPDAVLLAWLALPIIAFTWEWTDVAPHYMIPLMPAAFILIGAGGEAINALDLPVIARRVTLGITGSLVLLIAGLQILLFVKLIDFLDTHSTPDGFGTPLHYLLDARQTIFDQQPAEVIIISDQELAPYDEIPAVWGVLLDGVPDVRFVDGTRTILVPAADPADNTLELVYWSPDLLTCAPTACPGDEFELRPSETPLIVRPTSTPNIQFAAIEPVRLANEAYLTGYATDVPNGIILRWELRAPTSADYLTFVHVLDADGTKLDQADRPVWPGRYWRAGDTLWLWYEVDVPPAAVEIYTGMYLIEEGTYRNAEVLDENGAYVGQGATITLRQK